ncbi:DUF2971 domain-containing protein [Thalassotalea sp. LPB0316]|uniref:DUF2971 domain-containing protein n=1 Tax=Thalassotalea sp. LPB0316 TaxID=2769490 RepID=UPI00186806B2|nr:DUF2971 domain-containing protein [Thalassotalea sp. LPB0316]QOL25660.1 DUF2971 domain-containing protein [Thalassotalea sp. LPB0316]
MKNPEIKSLFKYSPIEKNQLNALAECKLWYSKAARFNDPFDTRFYIDGRLHAYSNEFDPVKLTKAFGKQMSDSIVSTKISLKGHLDTFKREIEELGILSLAASNKNLLMWSHYAAEHSGMCLEFSREDNNQLTNDKETQPVFYSDNHPRLNPKSLLDKDKRLSSKRRILYTKSRHWEYEQEWRHIVETGDDLYPWPGKLKAVYFGCKVNPQDIKLVKKVINSQNVKFYKAELNTATFGMTFNNI